MLTSKRRRYITSVVIVVVMLLVFRLAFSELARPTSGTIVGNSVDRSPAIKVVLDDGVADEFRRSIRGIGVLSPVVHIIPHGVFDVGGASLWWTGAHIMRVDYPVEGWCVTWSFPMGDIACGKARNGDQFNTLIECLKIQKEVIPRKFHLQDE